MIDISKKDKRAVLIALYKDARVQGMGFIHARGNEMTLEEAGSLIEAQRGRFDYVHGRVLKVDLNDALFDPRLYDRDNGHGAAQHAVAAVPDMQ